MSVMSYLCILCVDLLSDPFVLCIAYLTLFVNFFGKTICNIFLCGCYFVVECYGCV